jgi:hypothetical protein
MKRTRKCCYNMCVASRWRAVVRAGSGLYPAPAAAATEFYFYPFVNVRSTCRVGALPLPSGIKSHIKGLTHF